MHLPWTIWRLAWREVWRLTLISGGVLCVIAAFAVTVKPLADGRLGPAEGVRFLGLALLPMLQYVLPFAGGFAATLAYHRMVSDNEVTAAHAGGVSHRALLLPSAAVGALLGVLLWGLSDRVIPRFLRSMERLVAQDVARSIVTAIESDRPFGYDNVLIHADAIRRLGPDPESSARERLLLSGVGLVTLDETGAVDFEATARRARVWLYDAGSQRGADGGRTVVAVRLEDVLPVRAGDIAPPSEPNRVWDLARAVPGTFSDDPKFLSSRDLDALDRHPERMNWIDAERRELAAALADAEARAQVRASLAAEGRLRLTDADGRSVVIRAAGCAEGEHRWDLLPLEHGPDAGFVRVERFGAGEHAGMQAWRARAARLSADPGADPAAPRGFTLHLEQTASIVSTGRDESTLVGGPATLDLAPLRVPGDPFESLRDRPIDELQALARAPGASDDPGVRAQADQLAAKVASLRREILSKRHERWAASAACAAMAVVGAVTALRLRGRLPLVVYLWAFLPALAAVLTISAGQQMVHEHGPIALPILWGGVIGLIAYAGAAFSAVARH